MNKRSRSIGKSFLRTLLQASNFWKVFLNNLQTVKTFLLYLKIKGNRFFLFILLMLFSVTILYLLSSFYKNAVDCFWNEICLISTDSVKSSSICSSGRWELQRNNALLQGGGVGEGGEVGNVDRLIMVCMVLNDVFPKVVERLNVEVKSLEKCYLREKV